MARVNEFDEGKLRGEGVLTLHIDSFKTNAEQFESPIYYIRTLPWSIVATPRKHALSVFLKCHYKDDFLEWHCKAVFELKIKSDIEGGASFSRGKIKHTFSAKGDDYGFIDFITWSELIEANKGYCHLGCITIEAHVVADPPQGMIWDSKRNTGFVGLKNQGVTCYMNSLLQSLFFTNQLRLAVYNIPTERDERNSMLALALQYVFYSMQFGEHPVSAKTIINSFGLTSLESVMQHDVQEFLRLMLEKLEARMSGTNVENVIPTLLQGNMSTYIRCRDVNYSSVSNETFYDIQLQVKGNADILSSFQQYITSEELIGENRYNAGALGMQDANKGVIFVKFPPVLHLHLLRFEYDPLTRSPMKNNDEYKFYENINLDRFLSVPPTTPTDYVLHTVLVHAGNNESGHYVAFINPKADGCWYKFNDAVVTACSKVEAIDENFGGAYGGTTLRAECSSAYMLVYIRQSELANVLADVPKELIPRNLVARLERISGIDPRNTIRSSGNITINILLEDHFRLPKERRLYSDVMKLPEILMIQSQTVEELIAVLTTAFGVSDKMVRIWPLITKRSQKFLYMNVEQCASRRLDQLPILQNSRTLFVQMTSKEHSQSGFPPFDPLNEVLIFLKYYDASSKNYIYLGWTQVPINKTLNELTTELRTLIGLPPNTKLNVFRDENIWLVDQKQTIKVLLQLRENNFLHGHCLVFEEDSVANDADADAGTTSDMK